MDGTAEVRKLRGFRNPHPSGPSHQALRPFRTSNCESVVRLGLKRPVACLHASSCPSAEHRLGVLLEASDKLIAVATFADSPKIGYPAR